MTHGGMSRGKTPFILASASARRRAILESLGVQCEVIVPIVEEREYPADPTRTVVENSLLKNAWCRMRRPDCFVLAADTVVELDGCVISKPRSLEEAGRFFRMFSGRDHRVLTAVAFSRPQLPPETKVDRSTVVFKTISDEVIARYFESVDPLDKAGGYDINDHGDLIVESMEGSYTNVMGLPVEIIQEWTGRCVSTEEYRRALPDAEACGLRRIDGS